MSGQISVNPHKPHPKVKFTNEEDQLLKEIVDQIGPTNWSLISSKMKGRNPRQCKERWENYLSPNINHSSFAVEEDILLLQKYAEIGPKWVQISKYLQNRSDTSVKSRFMVLKRRGVSLNFLPTSIPYSAPSKPTPSQTDDIIAKLSNKAEEEIESFWGFDNQESSWAGAMDTDFF